MKGPMNWVVREVHVDGELTKVIMYHNYYFATELWMVKDYKT